jgi:hypothetical protein
MKIIEYDRLKAIEYAYIWAKKRNPVYYNFDRIGGDCTNFVSQCLYSGCGVMNYEKVFGWFYNSINDRSPSWTGVEFLYSFLIKRNRIGPFATLTDKNLMKIGDVIQLGRYNGDFFHTAIVTDIKANEILVSSHTRDFYNVPLSVYNYDQIRYLHIEGIYV